MNEELIWTSLPYVRVVEEFGNGEDDRLIEEHLIPDTITIEHLRPLIPHKDNDPDCLLGYDLPEASRVELGRLMGVDLNKPTSIYQISTRQP